MNNRIAIAFAAAVLAFFFATSVTKSGSPKIWEEFSGEKAFAHIQRLVDFGPRPAGSTAIEKSRDYIEDQLRRFGWQATRQTFSDDTPRGKIHFVNLLAQFSGQENARASLLLLSRITTPKCSIPFGLSAPTTAAPALACSWN